MRAEQTIQWKPFSDKHKAYIKKALKSKMSVAEGAIRSGKTIDHCIIAAAHLETCKDKIHLASGSTIGNAKLNIGVCNGYGLENLFRGRCKWGKYRDNEALFLQTQTGDKVVVFTGGGKADSYKRILGNSYGLWIATEINEHYDSDDSRTSFIKVAFGRQLAAEEPLTLWDLNPCSPKHKIYTDYIDAYLDTEDYQYQHFTVKDNLSVTPERMEELLHRYTPGTVWYRRDISGERCIAEGLIYQKFADNPQAFFVDKADIPKLDYINIGVDFGGSGSQHAFVATGITADYKIYVLKAESIPAKGVDVDELLLLFKRFADGIQERFGADDVYCDSAEQTIINTLQHRTDYSIRNSIKNEIVDRIRATCLLISSGRLRLLRGECDNLVDGLCTAVWDSNELDDVRLDDGTSNIDILDAFEYSWEYFIQHMDL